MLHMELPRWTRVYVQERKLALVLLLLILSISWEMSFYEILVSLRNTRH